MIPRRWPVALLMLTAAGAPEHRRSAAPITVDLIGPSGGAQLDSITASATVRAVGAAPEDRPITVGLEIATTADFSNGILVDTSVSAESATVAIPRALPSDATVYIRGRATTILGQTTYSATSTRTVPTWIRLLTPGPGSGVVTTRRPTFYWAAARVRNPPGPWSYTFQVIGVSTGQIVYSTAVADTTFVPPIDLDLSTSYRWAIVGRIGADSLRVVSPSTFIIANQAVPGTTILYQNFPNPFPSPTSSETCVWFDLATDALVQLDILDLQGRIVRVLIPPIEYGAGRHGRATSASPGTCAGDIRWNGNGENGRPVPAGAYLVRLQAGKSVAERTLLFLGK